MIEFRNFSKDYNGATVYDNFSLSIEEGKITCILGESGSGKTTLLNALAGLIQYSGDIPRLKCSYVFQTPRLVPNLTVYGNLKLICNDDVKISDMLEKVRLSDKADCYPVKLSGGQAQRVAIARAFLYESDVILLDEPFSSLDLSLKLEITDLFLDIWRRDGRTALFVTHDIDEAARIAHRIIILSGGKIIHDCPLNSELPRTEEQTEELRHRLIPLLL